MGKNITSAQFNFAPDELAFIGQNFIHLDHDQTWTASAGAAYTLNMDTDHPTRFLGRCGGAERPAGDGGRRGTERHRTADLWRGERVRGAEAQGRGTELGSTC